MKWSPVLGSCICVCVCVCECCDFTSVDGGEKRKKKSKSRYISGAKYSSTRPSSEARNYKNNTYIDTVVKLWVTRLYLELWLVFGDILEPQKDQINSAR